ncbi:neuronal acetylcholine receptor subunit alpha-7-like [Ruditapes philippinarum]|uniref:neuronal acetylcholine receptor subunit alpha-7-like n=1 Tax=Ruditapes philippinarum TaxID=129788 RepID=UPI00295B24B4|nr:neuronal acetylcholine receptor subunit alpha-7-like [Ruditapes philippinarum]
MEVTYILFCVVCHIMIEKGHGNTFWEYKKLYRHLEENFDKTIRPVINQSKSVIVGIDFNLQAIQGLDEKEQVLQSSIALTCNWKYETLVWNESEFSEIKTMYIPPVDAWIPDLIAINSIDSLYVLTENRADMLQIKVESNGDAQWYTGGNIRTSCNIDITKYPFDVQHCTIVISKTTPDTEVLIDVLRDQCFNRSKRGKRVTSRPVEEIEANEHFVRTIVVRYSDIKSCVLVNDAISEFQLPSATINEINDI